jgi:RNA polymerase sigma factor (sigma-70 family)
MASRPEHDRARFRTTSWSLVAAAAGGDADVDTDNGVVNENANDALQRLCLAYWYPVYSFIRRHGSDRDEAEDLTQGFFAKLLEKDYLVDADQSRGRFRTFLLASVKHFIANERDRNGALKRGGHVLTLSLDFEQAESRYQIEPVEQWTADAIYDRNWAISLLREVLDSIEADYQTAGKGDLFAALSPKLTGQRNGQSLAEIATQLQTTTGAVKVAAHRLRSTYREKLVEAVAATLVVGDDVDEERKILLDAIAGGRP